ncbi:uncharacterized protein [Clytia hemisphaerica]|uniref:Chromo domain-containing protein n=3 Tax=Clytia hemisphaerica TaxID=252671 RepID=A0A7M5X9C0_9CNID
MSVQRVIKTPEQVKILDELYERGMTSYGRDHKEVKKLIEEAVERTGLTAQQIKNWINHQKKPTDDSKKEKVLTRKPRGYDLFRREELAGKVNPTNSVAAANKAWADLSAEERKEFNERASQVVIPKFEDLSPDAQKIKLTSIRNKIKQLCTELESYGVDTLVIEADSLRMGRHINAYGSTKARDFWEAQEDLYWDFSTFINGTSHNKADQKPSKSVRQEVADLLNSRFLVKTREKPLEEKNTESESDQNIELEGQNVEAIDQMKNTEPIEDQNIELEGQNVEAIDQVSTEPEEVTHKKNHRKRKAAFDDRLEDICRMLDDDDLVPNASDQEVTLKEVKEKDERNEGYVEYIKTHGKVKGGERYFVKWIGFKKLTWEKAEHIPEHILSYYKCSLK